MSNLDSSRLDYYNGWRNFRKFYDYAMFELSCLPKPFYIIIFYPDNKNLKKNQVIKLVDPSIDMTYLQNQSQHKTWVTIVKTFLSAMSQFAVIYVSSCRKLIMVTDRH